MSAPGFFAPITPPAVTDAPTEAAGKQPALLPCWPQAWFAQAYEHCKSQPHCANEFGVAWRYQVPRRKRATKPVGLCLCERYADTAPTQRDLKNR